MKLSTILQHFRTLRFRLAVLYLIVFGIIQVGFCLVILNVRERYLREDFDERLVDRAETMVEAISIRAGEANQAQRGQRITPRLNPFRFPGYYFQIRADAGEIRERSRNLASASLPLSDAGRDFSGKATSRARDDHWRSPRVCLLMGHESCDCSRFITISPVWSPFFLQVGDEPGSREGLDC